jgi:hypothetical protein
MGMAERRLNRRKALMGSGLVGVGGLAVLLAGCGTDSAQSVTSVSAALEGTWRIDVSLDDGTKHQGLILCTRDGGVGVSATLTADSFAMASASGRDREVSTYDLTPKNWST